MSESSSRSPSLGLVVPHHPHGSPAGLREHLAEASAEEQAPGTIHVVALSEGVGDAQVLVDQSAEALFERICGHWLHEGARVALSEPFRAGFVQSVLAVGARYVDPGRGADWEVQEGALERLLEDGGLSMVVLGRPCAPAGGLPSKECVQRCLDAGLLVVVDESWLPFSGGDEPSLAPLINGQGGGRLMVLREYGSAWGLDEEGSCYAVMGADLASELEAMHPGSPLSPRAERALRWMLESPHRREGHARILRDARDAATTSLRAISGLQLLPGRGPWIGFRCPGWRGSELADRLGDQGIQTLGSDHWSWRDAVAVEVPPTHRSDALTRAVQEVLSGP